MSISVSSDVKESGINFDRDSVISNDSDWVGLRGEFNKGEELVLGSSSACRLVVNLNKMKCSYFKLLARVTSNDKTLSTDNFNKVSIVYKIMYEVDGKESVVTNIFYPKYDFEIKDKADFTIISTPQTPINTIEVTIYNNEDVEVSIVETGLFISKLVDANDIGDIAVDAVQDAMYNNMFDLVIPLIDQLPSINDVPDGVIYRCAWIEGV